MGDIELLQTLKNINSINCLVIENYVYKKDYISKWFSVLEVSREMMDYEQKVTFRNGKIVKNEYKGWCNAVIVPFYSMIITEISNGNIITKHYDRHGKLWNTTKQSEEEHWNIWGNIQISHGIDAIFNEEKQKRTYEYQYDRCGNWVEKRTTINGKLEYLTIRKFRYA